MKKYRFVLTGLTAIAIFWLSACQNTTRNHEPLTDAKSSAESAMSRQDTLHYGEYLVKTMGCNDCHSPKRIGPKGPELVPELMLSGYPSGRPVPAFDSKLLQEGFAILVPDMTAAAGPWGISFAANLTPDETGIGNWSLEQFRKAMVHGKYKGLDGSRNLLPPMPVQNFSTLTDKDLKSMFAYLKSLKPVRNVVPSPIAPTRP